MGTRDPNELAERAGVPASYVDRLIELGIVSAGEDGTFSDADVYRVRFVWSSDRGGLSIEAIARAIHDGHFSLEFLDGPSSAGPRSRPGPMRRSRMRSASPWSSSSRSRRPWGRFVLLPTTRLPWTSGRCSRLRASRWRPG